MIILVLSSLSFGLLLPCLIVVLAHIPPNVPIDILPIFSLLVASLALSLVSVVLDLLLVIFGQTPRFSTQAKNFLIALVMITFLLFYGGLAFWRLEGWQYYQAVTFCLVTITTVGFGNLVPTDNRSKIILIFYALVGLAFIGFAIEQFRRLLVQDVILKMRARIQRLHYRGKPGEDPEKGPRRRRGRAISAIWVARICTILGVLVWWTVGAAIFMALEGWNYLDSFYFSFTTLATIGYGDFVPETTGGMIFLLFFLLFGLGLFTVAISTLRYSRPDEIDDQLENLLQEEHVVVLSTYPRNVLHITEDDSPARQLVKATSVIGAALVLGPAVKMALETPLPDLVVRDWDRFFELSQHLALCLRKLEQADQADLAKWISEYRRLRDLFEATYFLKDR